MLKVVILAAGSAQRFRDLGYSTPKPLLPVGFPERCLLHRLVHWVSISIPKDQILVITNPQVMDFLRETTSPELLAAQELRGPDHYLYGVRIRQVPRILNGPVYSAQHAEGFIQDSDPVIFLDCDSLYSDYSLISRMRNSLHHHPSSVSVTPRPPGSTRYCGVFPNYPKLRESSSVSAEVLTGVYGFQSWGLFKKSSVSGNSEVRSPALEFKMSEVVNNIGEFDRVPVSGEDWLSFGTPLEYESRKILS